MPWFVFKITTVCQPHEFLCTNTRCVPSINKCNSQDDCGDDSDEVNCSISNTHIFTLACSQNQFTCDLMIKCFNINKICDGESDCEDGVDESNCPISI